ncbi:hypothetical protein I7I48_00187 [Histoplasma ohiense]|nr:hypothetical protein I7I48_00187 [Histoplasma ohiense (nom. inval.)]
MHGVRYGCGSAWVPGQSQAAMGRCGVVEPHHYITSMQPDSRNHMRLISSIAHLFVVFCDSSSSYSSRSLCFLLSILDPL